MRFAIIGIIGYLAAGCWAATVTVSHDPGANYNFIQDAIDYCDDGDTIIVKPGKYKEDVYFNGRAVRLTSEDPNNPAVVASTAIAGSVTFDMCENQESVLEGLTIGGDAFAVEKIVGGNGVAAYYPKISGDYLLCSQINYNTSEYELVVINLKTRQNISVAKSQQEFQGTAISGDTVVYALATNILGFSISTGQTFIICIGHSNDRGDPAIYGNFVVWCDQRNGYYNSDIYGYDLIKHQEFLIHQGQASYPAIYGNVVVWTDGRSGGYDIYGYNLETKQEFPICTKSYEQSHPAIFGDYVVWQDYRSGDYAGVYGYDLKSQQEFAINTIAYGCNNLVMFGNTVAWNNSGKIHFFDIATHESRMLTQVGEQYQPALYDHTIAWVNGNDQSIYVTTSELPSYVESGIVCFGTSPTIRKNIIQNCTNYGIFGYEAYPAIISNSIQTCGNYGISYCNGAINSNTISQCSTAITNNSGTISANYIYNNRTGISDCYGNIENNILRKNITAISSCSGVIKNNIISDNNGTGVVSSYGSVQNNIISGNDIGVAEIYGTICNNTFTGNKMAISYSYSGTIKNNIVAFNELGINYQCNNNYNCFWKNTNGNFANGGYGRTGDFSADPKFAVAGHKDDKGTLSVDDDEWIDGDYHLQSEAGRWDDTAKNWVYDTVISPCIDKGDPMDSISSEPNPNGGRINIGAYGGTGWASKSKSGTGPDPTVTCSSPISGDVNNDCKVNLTDFAIMASHWLECNLVPRDACEQMVR